MKDASSFRKLIRKIIPFKIRKILKNTYIKVDRLFRKKYYFHKDLYMKITNKELNLDNPKTFDEKIHWLILNKFGQKEANLADKIAVKEYVEKINVKGLKIPKTLKIYNNVDEINLDELPDKFVLKCNHWSGIVFICNNKKEFDLSSAKAKLDEIVKQDFADVMGEYHYSLIKPCIYAEEYLDDLVNKNPIDYKIYCVDQKAKSILVCSEREFGLRLSEYDLDWNPINCLNDNVRPKKEIPKPKHLKKMIKMAEQLSKDIPFVRVDLYCIGDSGKIYFGEYTLTPAAGVASYYNDYGQIMHGEYINLDEY